MKGDAATDGGTGARWRRPGEVGTVLVSGGASGLGRAVVQATKSAGGQPLVVDRDPPDDEVDYLVADVGDARAAEAAVCKLADRAGRLDAIFTAAGIDRCGPLTAVAPDEWDTVIRVNLLGTAAIVRAALPYLERSRGRVITCASTLGLRAVPDATAYCASKFGVVGFTRALAAETAGRIGVTLLVPGGMATGFFDDRPEKYKPPADLRLNRPADVAAAVVFALRQPPGCEIRELVVCPSEESSWP